MDQLRYFRSEGARLQIRSPAEWRTTSQPATLCRLVPFVYNKALALNKQRYENKEKRLGYAGMCALLPSWKTAHPWLSDAPSQALQQSLKDLERAYEGPQGFLSYPARIRSRQQQR